PALLQSHPVTLQRIADAKARVRMIEGSSSSRDIPPLSRKQWEKITAPIRFVKNPQDITATAKGSNHQSSASLYALMRERVRALSLSPTRAVDYYKRHVHRKSANPTAVQYGYALALIRHGQARKALKKIKPLMASHPSSLPI